MDKNPPANAGDTGSIPGLGRLHMSQSSWARAPQILSVRCRASEPQLLKPGRSQVGDLQLLSLCAAASEACTWSLCSATREAIARRSPTKSSPGSPQLDKSLYKAVTTQHSQKLKKRIPDWLIKITLLVKVKTAVRCGVLNLGLVPWALAHVTPFGACGFSL